MNFRRSFNVLFLSLIVILGASCNGGITYPSVSETVTENYNPGQFVWHDLATSNPTAAMKFYGEVFGWEFETLGSGDNLYHVIKNNGKAIGGIFQLAPKYGDRSEWVGSISVQNLDAALKFNEASGGKTIFDTAEFDGRGSTALIQDPQGAIVALLKSSTGDPASESVMNNSWLWNELWTTNLEGSLNFYKGLVLYETEEVKQGKAPYFIFSKNGTKLSGAIKNPIEEGRTAWMPYIKVADVDQAASKAEAAGAYIVMNPNQGIRNGTVAVLIDPVGAQLTIQEWN
ncbi:VOC family protein [Marinigracilibium pacificum]|uniref:VOC family protein n=1 Tax=Marinigracilibium pacificum TaxID=2729599 RepID=A0A848ITU8_9BACT|nr:VOC family protein [Marinigracilibium pacificum]NMM47913.1 VOC family protein [Marinigracilibium pacificum]